ncbi:MAG: DUF2520 domain-containing protein [Pseudomonadota bacterium]
MKPRLHILGCGRAARTLARLWVDRDLLDIGRVQNQSLSSAQSAVNFIRQGQAVVQLSDGSPGDWLMLGLPDGELPAQADALRQSGLQPFQLVFHLSGSESSAVLSGVAKSVASVHPVCPFSEPVQAMRQLPGTFAVGEGDAAALDAVLPKFSALEMQVLRLPDHFDADKKRLYHAATITASNFLNTLDAMALALTDQADIPEQQARSLIASLQRVALAQIEQVGPRAALTGPIERADRTAIARMVGAIQRHAPGQMPLFTELAAATVDLAAEKHPERTEQYNHLRTLLTGNEASDGRI